ncbi:MAG: GtrA family protein [Candidatus Peribacteraceae bacterium]|nr:GtrA family protein [Candidatus Peribacteraceae bacterium]
MFSPALRRFLPHATKFALYSLSGSTAAVADLGSYFLMLRLGVWYLAASVVSGVVGFFTAFLLHKYFVYRKRSAFMKHLLRYFVVDMMNLVVINSFLFVLVDVWDMDPRPAKFVALAPVVLWNFFVYKFAVYV